MIDAIEQTAGDHSMMMARQRTMFMFSLTHFARVRGAAARAARRFALVMLSASLFSGCAVAPTPVAPCDVPMTICTVAGTGLSQFDGDGRPALRTSLYYPLDVVFDARGRALVLDWNNLRVRRINDAGDFETVIGTDFEDTPVNGDLAINTPLHHASDIEFDANGRLYLAGNHSPVIFMIGLDDRVRVVAGNGDFGNDGDGGPATNARIGAPWGVVHVGDGSFYFGDEQYAVVRYVDTDGTISTVAGNGTNGYSGDGGPATAAQLEGPTRLRRGADGALLICDTRNHAIRRVDRDGIISTIAGDGTPGYSGDGRPAIAARLNSPYDIALAPEGALLIADTGNNVIRRIDRDGVITTVVGKGTAGYAGDEADAAACELDGPSGVTIAPDGSLWISDTFNNRVRRVAGFANFPQS